MNIFELEKTLPNGFHDAQLLELAVFWADQTSILKLQVWVGDLSGPKAERERYKYGELRLTGVGYLYMDRPDPNYPAPMSRPLIIDLTTAEDKSLADSEIDFRFWVSAWNGFIHLQAACAELHWLEENNASTPNEALAL